MAKVKIQGHASGTGVFTLTSPNSNTDRTITLPDADVTLGTDATKLPLAGGTLTGNVTGVKLGLGVAPTRFIDIKGAQAVGGGGSEIYQRWQVQSDNANVEIGFSDSPRQFNFGTATSNALSLKTNNTERLHINSSGNVGIGTSSPDEKLDVEGTIQTSRTDGYTANWKQMISHASSSYNGTLYFTGSTSTGGVIFRPNGSPTVSFPVAGGITFGSDTAAANALDDYEEGTFTLAMFSGQNGSITNTTANYTKIGRNVTLNFYGVINNAQNNSYVRISGFPFTLPNIGIQVTAASNQRQVIGLYMSSGGYFYYQNDTVGGNNAGENAAWLDSATNIYFNVTYII